MTVIGDARRLPFPDGVAQCAVTSPPYYGLRDYCIAAQIGLEQTPAAYVAELVAVFRECWRVLRDDGVAWLNLGDSYAANRGYQVPPTKWKSLEFGASNAGRVPDGYKPKDMLGIPWRVAFALQDDGWYLRSDCIWHKPNPMPESVTDRPTKAHEYVFLLSKQARYYYDAEAVAEPANQAYQERYKYQFNVGAKEANGAGRPGGYANTPGIKEFDGTRNARTVWTIATRPYSGAHFATMPPALAEKCILAGSRPGDIVLDPFSGAGTTERVAIENGRRFIGTELNPKYIALRSERVAEVPVRML